MSRFSTSTLFAVFMPLVSTLSLFIALAALFIHPPHGYEDLFANSLVLLLGLAIILWSIPILVAIKRLPPPPSRT